MDVNLTAEIGRATGSRASNRLRRGGRIPGVVYGLGKDVLTVSVAWPELRKALSTEAGLNALIDLEVDGDSTLTIVKELQRDPVRRTVTHVDFVRIDPDAEIEVDVPVVLHGETEELTAEGGLVDHALYNLTIKAKPGSIPTEVSADISGLTIGSSVRVGDIPLPEGVSTDVDPDDPVATGYVPRVEIEEPTVEELEEEEAAEVAEGEEAEAAEAAEGPTEPVAEAEPGGGES